MATPGTPGGPVFGPGNYMDALLVALLVAQKLLQAVAKARRLGAVLSLALDGAG